jgi:class 3 adenylate cyclase
MKCANCKTENPEMHKFCRECGEKLLPVCPRCGYKNLHRDKYCGECGRRLEEPSGARKKVWATESERKHVTVLFSDLVGYTAMTEKLDPEEVKEIMSRIFREIAKVVAKYEGFIERFVGDAVMAIFGVPKAHEDDGIRAIKAAREIHARVEALGPQFEERVGKPLAMHSGINTGLVVTGEINLEKGTHGIIGDVINLASRIGGVAKTGEILVGLNTYRQAAGYFIFERLGPKRVKGKGEPVNVYRVIAPSTRRTRFDVSAEQGLTPLVGRERELELLLEGFERSKEGRGQAFSIVSEAGMGKSRLLYEFRKAVANEDVTFLEGKCLSYSRGVAYNPVIDILKSNFDIREGEREREIREKIKIGLKILGVDESLTLPYLLALLSVKDSGIDKMPISPEEKKDRTIEALRRIVLRGSGIRPLILAVEDLHWVDKSSEEISKYLLESIPGASVLLLFTYRPEYVPVWGVKSYHNQLNLIRLSNRDSLEMMAHILGTKDIQMDLREMILEKTEGVPFFIEEFIKSFKDLKIIEIKDKYYLAKDLQDLTIPTTIQDVIMARVDSLPEGAKEVLQTGSVIEREFSYELVKVVTGLSEQELLHHLSVLTDSELLYERGIYPQSTYIFNHALTRDVVYDSILIKIRKKLHGEIGNAIEELYKENIDEHSGVLAEHFIESENYEKAAEYSRLAARKAQKAASYRDAIEHAMRRVFCLERLPVTEVIQRKVIDARTLLAGYYMSLSHWVKAKPAVLPVLELALKLDYKRRLPGIYNAIGLYSHWVEEDYSKTFQYLNDSIKFSEETGDYVSQWFASLALGCAQSWNCEFENAFKYFEKTLQLSELGNNPVGISITKGTMSAFRGRQLIISQLYV